MLDKDTLVSVIILGENTTDDELFTVFKNVTEQTHKNLDIIISTFREDVEDIQERCAKLNLDTRWAQQQPGQNFIKELTDIADGEIICYKTCNNALWFKRHIEAHVENFKKDKGTKWALSHIENRNIEQPDSPFNTLSFRIENPPDPASITMDEIFQFKEIETDWSLCLTKKDGVPLFYPGYAIKQWIEGKYRGTIPPEITVIQWQYPGTGPNEKSVEDFYKQVGVPVKQEIEEKAVETDQGIEVIRSFPTIVGNFHLNDFSDNIRTAISQTQDITSVALKRTIGMGDIVLVEPIIKKIKERWPNAPLNFYTAKPEIVDYFVNKPDKITSIEEDSVVKDILGERADEQIKIDLDLSYESREQSQFIDAYAAVADLEFNNQKEKHVQLVCDEEPLIKDKYVVVVGDGSGWPGKTWPIEKYAEVVRYIKSLGYKVYETGYEVTDEGEEKYHKCDLKEMVNLIANCEFFVGGDNGPMHIARGFNRPCIAINGAALTYLSNPNHEDIFYLEDRTHGGHGIKHKQFFNLTEQGLTFVPYFEDGPDSGLNSIEAPDVIAAIEKFFAKPNGRKFSFNVGGTLVKRDVVPGFAYYKDENGCYYRDKPFYHPDQRLNISQIYDQDKDNVWENNFKPVMETIKEDGLNGDSKILDLGCNMGIFINGMYKEGYKNITGYDINRLSILHGKETNKDIADNLFIKDVTSDLEEEGVYDAVLAGDVMGHVGDCNKVLDNVNKVLKDDGIFYLNTMIIDGVLDDTVNFYNNSVGNGENITLFSKESLQRLLYVKGFEYEDYGTWTDEERKRVAFLKCRKVQKV